MPDGDFDLLLGEDGTGRGLLAHYVHLFGGDPDSAFAHIPCEAGMSVVSLREAFPAAVGDAAAAGSIEDKFSVSAGGAIACAVPGIAITFRSKSFGSSISETPLSLCRNCSTHDTGSSLCEISLSYSSDAPARPWSDFGSAFGEAGIPFSISVAGRCLLTAASPC